MLFCDESRIVNCFELRIKKFPLNPSLSEIVYPFKSKTISLLLNAIVSSKIISLFNLITSPPLKVVTNSFKEL